MPDDHKKNRQAGVLLHISSLPSGNLGQDAYQFVDFLAASGASIWQTLPINMPHADNSPYQCVSAHAGNTAFICLQKLVEEGLINDTDIALGHHQALNVAHSHFNNQSDLEAFKAFCINHQSWLNDYALYSVLRQTFQFVGWNEWEEAYKNREESVLIAFKAEYATAIEQVKFHQYLFFKQWHALKVYANSKKVSLFGDIPIFVAYDSAEVWANPQLFKLDENKEMTVVAGVPPDYFSETGQRWGNPHYAWDVMSQDNYAWWVERMRTQSELFNLVRIDHFRGLEAAWEIPATEETAMNGTWVEAPGDALLSTIYKQLPDLKLIAEDLGIITQEVDELRLKFSMPGMKILQFAFGGDETNPYLPENIEENSVVYTGTHDNDTTLGWYKSADERAIKHLHSYLKTETPTMPYALMALAFSTKASIAIVPMQDILGLGSDCRMNTPGTTIGNWAWHFEWQQLTEEYRLSFTKLIASSERTYD